MKQSNPEVVLNVTKDDITVEGVWPGLEGAVAILVYGHPKNIFDIIEVLERMRKGRGANLTEKLERLLERGGVDSVMKPIAKGHNRYPESSRFYDMLEQLALKYLKCDYNGHLKRGPFIISTVFLEDERKQRIDKIQEKQRFHVQAH